MGKMFPDYKNNLVNFYSSLSKSFGVECEYSSIKMIDKLIKKAASTNIIVLIYNGLSSTILERYNCDFILNNKLIDITVDYSGINDFNTYVNNGTLLTYGYNYILGLIERINNSNNEYSAYGVFPYDEGSYEEEVDAYSRIENLCKDDNKKVIFVYFDNIGKVIRSNKDLEKTITSISNDIEKLRSNIKDSSIFITADYGYIDCDTLMLNEIPRIMKHIDSYAYITDRVVSVNLKNENIAYFKRISKEVFGDEVVVLSNYEINSKRLINNTNLSGDAFLVCVGKKSFGLNNYGGFSEDEVLVPLIYLSSNKDSEVIRKVRKEDYEFIYKGMLEIQKKKEKWSNNLFYRRIPLTKDEFLNLCDKNYTDSCFVYEKNGNVIGFIIIELKDFRKDRDIKDKTNLVVSSVYVKSVYRRQGIGTKLFSKVLEYSKSLHLNNIYVFAWCFDEEFMNFIGSLNSRIVCNLIEITGDNVK